MIIRKINKKRKWPIILLAILILIAVFYKYHDYFGQINFWKNNFSRNNLVNIKWNIKRIDKIWYSEYFLVMGESKILLRDYPKNIDNLVWNNILANWEIKKEWYNQAFFIKSLKDLDNNISIENNNYLFADALILLNTKEMPWILPLKEWNKIVIYYRNNPLLNISTFGCSKISDARDCKTLIDNFNANENEYFSSYNWLEYYKIENNKRELFNDTLLWYYIETKDDDVLLNLSSMIEIINSDYIFDNKKNIILDNCKDLFNIDNVDITGKEWNFLTVNVKWKNKNKINSECSVTFDMMSDWAIVKDK